MAKHLPDPAGEPDRAAQEIIDAIHAYRDAERDPVTTTRGLRHIYHHAERAWDASVAKAKEAVRPNGTKVTYADIMDATGDALGTLQGRIRAHRDNMRKPSRRART